MNLEASLTQYEKRHKSQIIKINPSSISLSGSKIMCRRCQRIFDLSQYNKHSKNCKKIASRHSLHLIDKSRVVTTAQFEEKDLSDDQEFYNNLLTSVLCFIKTGVQELLSNTKYLRRGVVLKILGKKCIDFASRIPDIIDQNDFRSLVSDVYMSQILTNINDVFSPNLVEVRMSNFSENRKSRIRKKLNGYLKKLQIEPLYSNKQKISHVNERSKLPLMFRELSEFVLKLFGTKKKKYVHLGLDLLIIFHSMQRFPSSLNIIKLKVQQIMKKYNQSKITFALIQKTTKTLQKVNIFLNSSLIELLIQFNWEDFAFNQRFYERFSQFFNFSMFSLRRGSITEAEIFLNKTDVNILTNHVSGKSTDYYLVELQKFKNKEFHESLVLEDPDKMKKKYQKYEKLDRIFPTMLTPLNNDGGKFEFKLHTLPKTQSLEEFIRKPTRPENEDADLSQDSSEQDVFQENIIIDGFPYRLKNGILQGNIFFETKSKQNCKICQKNKVQFICIFCLKTYHKDCLPDFCPCMKFTVMPVQIQSNITSLNDSLYIKMPHQYFNNNEALIISIRKFIHMRGFYFTTTSTLFEGNQLFTPNTEGAEQFSIFPDYEKYERGKYFPPLIIGVSGDENSSGTGVGLFCQEDIESNVFIGQYGGDIVSEDEMIFIKRRDMSMQITSIDGKKYYVGCIKHCSYVQLINCSKEKANCRMILGIVNRKLKLLLYTTKKINKGCQLLYDYGEGFETQFKSGLRDVPQSLQAQIKKNESNIKKGIIQNSQKAEVSTNMKITQEIKLPKQQIDKFNKFKKTEVQMSTNTCYAECLLVVYKYFRELFLGSESNISKEVFKKKIDPKQIITEFKQFRRLSGQNKDQQDILELFTFIENFRISNDSPFQQITILQTKTCLFCTQKSSKYSSQKQWYIDEEAIRLSNTSIVESECQKCQKNQDHSLDKKVLSSPQVLLFAFKRNISTHLKKNHSVYLMDNFLHNNFAYTLELVVLHQGKFADEGHYYLRFPMFNYIFNSNSFIQSPKNIDFSKEVYLAFYKKKKETKLKRKHNVPTHSAGIFIHGISSDHTDQPFQIAEILYVIIFLVCKKIGDQNQIFSNHLVELTKNIFIDDQLAFKKNEFLMVGQLFELMMVCCCKDAVKALTYFFGKILKQKTGNTDYIADDMFKNKMVEFCRRQVGMMDTTLKYQGELQGISTIKDLKNLIDYSLLTDSSRIILSKSQIQIKGKKLKNKNQFYHIFPGLIEWNTKRANFLGFYEKDPIILLKFSCIQSLQVYLRQKEKGLSEKAKKVQIDFIQ